MGMYVSTSLADDIDMLGWNLCDCDDTLFQAKIGNCRVVAETIKDGIMEAVVEFPGQDDGMKEKLVNEFLNSWEDLVFHVYKGTKSRV